MTTETRNLDLFLGLQQRTSAPVRRTAKGVGPHVVAILPRGEAIRNFVYSGTLEEVSRHAEVSTLSVFPSEEFANLLRECSDSIFPLREIEERRVVNTVRELLDLAHGRWLWSEAAQERWRLRDLEARANQQRLRRQVKKLACYPFAHRAGLRFLSKCERAASRRFRTTDAYIKLFQELKPSLVFNGSHVHSRVAMQAVQAAHWLKIPTATFVFSWDNLTSQGRIMAPYDHYLVWNESLRDHLLQIYDTIRPDQVFVTGTPQFDFHFRPESHWSRDEFCARVGADAKRPIVLYSTGMPNHMPAEPQIVERIGAMLREMTEFGPPQLLVRVYPKDLSGRFEQVKRDNPEILFPTIPWEAAWLTPRQEDTPLLTNMLRHSAVGINVASTVSLELCMLDKPVLNVGYNPPSVAPSELEYSRYYKFDHYRKVVESGAVRVAGSEDELRGMLRRALFAPEADRAARRSLINAMFGDTLDGYSGLRVADCLNKLARLGAQTAEKELA